MVIHWRSERRVDDAEIAVRPQIAHGDASGDANVGAVASFVASFRSKFAAYLSLEFGTSAVPS